MTIYLRKLKTALLVSLLCLLTFTQYVYADIARPPEEEAAYNA